MHEGGRITVSVGSSSRALHLTQDIDLEGVRVLAPISVWSTLREWFEHPITGPRLHELIDSRGGIKGRMADLLSDETGRDAVLDVPLQTLIEFPGVPIGVDDVERIGREAE